MLLAAHSGPKMFRSKTFIIDAGAKDNHVFDDHVPPKGARIDAGWKSK